MLEIRKKFNDNVLTHKNNYQLKDNIRSIKMNQKLINEIFDKVYCKKINSNVSKDLAILFSELKQFNMLIRCLADHGSHWLALQIFVKIFWLYNNKDIYKLFERDNFNEKISILEERIKQLENEKN